MADSEVLRGIAESRKRENVEKLFRVPIVKKTKKDGKKVKVSLPLEVAQADQRSGMIIVTTGFLKKISVYQ